MGKITQKQIILNLLEKYGELPKYYFVNRETEWGWIGSEGQRRAQELAQDGLIEPIRKGKYTYYRLKKEPTQERLLTLKQIY